ncbi:MAG: CopG family antitoxin [Moorellaceae bacterium]
MTAELPKFKSEREEVEFWDTHNTLDYLESDEPAGIELDPDLEAKIRERQKTKRVTLRLRVSQIEAVKEIARRKDIPYQTLIRSWIAEAIQREQGRV